MWLSGSNGAVVNQALCISAGNNSVTPHPLLFSLLRPVGNAENDKLVSRAKQVQSRGDQPHREERKRNLWKNTGWSLFQMMPFCRILHLYPQGLILSIIIGSKQILHLINYFQRQYLNCWTEGKHRGTTSRNLQRSVQLPSTLVSKTSEFRSFGLVHLWLWCKNHRHGKAVNSITLSSFTKSLQV